MEIQVFPTLEELSHKAAAIFVDMSKKSIASKEKFSVAVSGGSTPRRFYSLLSSDPYRKRVSWHHVYFFWVDERCVPRDHEDSNFRVVFKTLLSKLSIPEDNINRIKGEAGPEKGAREYEEIIRKFFGKAGLPAFDLIILGIGEDGHIASIFPGSKALKKTAKLVVPVYTEKTQKHRITLTLPVLNNGSRIIILAAGSSKAGILHEILCKSDRMKQYPAGLIQPLRGSILWLVDEEAAALL